MTNNRKKGPTCPCGAGDQHSLRTAGLCGTLRNPRLNEAARAEIQDKLARIRGTGRANKGAV